MRMTAKLKAARETAIANDIPLLGNAEDLYQSLALHGLCWEASKNEWEPTKRPVRPDGTKSTSMFASDENEPTGIYRLRVMGHPDDLRRLAELLRGSLNITEESDQYPNRKGDGVRIYLTGKLPKTQLRGRSAKGRK